MCSALSSQSFTVVDDVSTSMKLQNAVSAIADWRINRALLDLWELYGSAEIVFPDVFYIVSLNVRSCCYLFNELSKIDSYLCVYFTAVIFLHVFYKTTRNGLNDEFINAFATALGQFVGKRRYSQLCLLGSFVLHYRTIPDGDRSLYTGDEVTRSFIVQFTCCTRRTFTKN